MSIEQEMNSLCLFGLSLLFSMKDSCTHALAVTSIGTVGWRTVKLRQGRTMLDSRAPWLSQRDAS